MAKLLSDVTADDVPEILRERFDREKAEEDARKKERAEAHLYFNVKVATDADLKRHGEADLVDFDQVTSFKRPRQSSLKELKAAVAQHINTAPERIRLWHCVARQNKTVRPDQPFKAPQEEQQLAVIAHEMNKDTYMASTDLKFFVEEQPGDKHGNEILIFFKFYSPETRTLQYIGSRLVPNMTKIQEIVPLILQLKGLPAATQLHAYEEVKPNMIESLAERQTLVDCELENGDILVFQTAASAQAALSMGKIPDYYDFLHNRVNVKFRSLDKPKEDQFTLELSRKMSYDQVAAKLSEKLGPQSACGADPLKVRLTVHNTYTDQPKPLPIKRADNQTLREMFNVSMYQQQKDYEILYYEELDLSIIEYETKRQLKVAWHNQKTEEVKIHSLLMPKESLIQDIFVRLQSMVTLETANKKMRLMETWNNKVQKVYSPNEPVASINEYTMHSANPLRCEEIADEELSADSKSTQEVYVTHFYRNPPLTPFHGAPFIMIVSQTETAAQLRLRIQKKLQIADEEFAKWKLARFSLAKPEVLQDDEVILSRPFLQGDFLGLEHAATHKPAQRTYEKPVKIYN
jgi:ubiquitin carboxyl-terminal hydrolase 7